MILCIEIKDFWTWLNCNAGAVQAISSIVIAGFTFVLVFITNKYVKLTKKLSDIASFELKIKETKLSKEEYQDANMIKSLDFCLEIFAI